MCCMLHVSTTYLDRCSDTSCQPPVRQQTLLTADAALAVLGHPDRFAQAEARANSTESAVALLEHTCVENGCRVQLKHVQSGRWLACRVDAARHLSATATNPKSATSTDIIVARNVLQLRSDGDESCWWVLCNSTGVGVGGMLRCDGRNGVYLSPSAATLNHSSSPRTIFIGPTSTSMAPPADGGLQLSVTAVLSDGGSVAAEDAAAAGASGWELRPCSRASPFPALDGVDRSTATSMDTPVPSFPAELRKERVLEYDAIRYPFREMLAKILDSKSVASKDQVSTGDHCGGESASCDLDKLHETQEGRQFIRRSPKASARNPYDRMYKAMDQTLREKYLTLYTRFLRVRLSALNCSGARVVEAVVVVVGGGWEQLVHA